MISGTLYISTYYHYIHTIIWKDINDDRQIDRQIDRQTDRQTDRLIWEKIWQDINQTTTSGYLQEWEQG